MIDPNSAQDQGVSSMWRLSMRKNSIGKVLQSSVSVGMSSVSNVRRPHILANGVGGMRIELRSVGGQGSI